MYSTKEQVARIQAGSEAYLFLVLRFLLLVFCHDEDLLHLLLHKAFLAESILIQVGNLRNRK